MIVYVINLDDETRRMADTEVHLSQWPDLEVRRFAAVTPDGIDPAGWEGARLRDPERRIAIIRSYRAVLQEAALNTADLEWVIMQDDVRFDRHPERPEFDAPLHLYTGWTLRRYTTDAAGYAVPVTPHQYREMDPWLGRHICPRAFRIRRPAIGPLLAAWSDETRQACETWTSYINHQTTTFDRPEAAHAIEEARS